jgi:hypothetical protein
MNKFHKAAKIIPYHILRDLTIIIAELDVVL